MVKEIRGNVQSSANVTVIKLNRRRKRREANNVRLDRSSICSRFNGCHERQPFELSGERERKKKKCRKTVEKRTEKGEKTHETHLVGERDSQARREIAVATPLSQTTLSLPRRRVEARRGEASVPSKQTPDQNTRNATNANIYIYIHTRTRVERVEARTRCCASFLDRILETKSERKKERYLGMIHGGGLAICSDAGRCSGVGGRQIPRIHRDLGARVNLPDSLGTGGRTHGRGLHHRWPHPVYVCLCVCVCACVSVFGADSTRTAKEEEIRQASKHARTELASRDELKQSHTGCRRFYRSVLSLSRVVFSRFNGGGRQRAEKREIVPGPGRLDPRRTRNGGTHHPASSSTITTVRSLPRTYIVSFCRPTPTS